MRFSVEEIMGARTRYLIGGEGSPLILVHGVGMSADSWLLSLPALAKEYRVAAPDLLDNGFTESGPYNGGPPQPYIVDHLIALADHLKFDRFTLVGSSLGAMITLLTYFKIPDRIDKIVLVGPGSTICPPPGSNDPPALQGSYENGKKAIEDPTYESCKARLGRVFHDAARVPDVVVAMQMLLYAMPGAMEQFERRMAGLRSPEARQYEVFSRLGEIKVPTLVLTGREDIRGKFSAIAESAKRLPNGKLLPYDRCGHWPHMEHPANFSRDVLHFLKS